MAPAVITMLEAWKISTTNGTVVEESLYLNVLTTVIPEFTTIAIPVAAVLGLFMLMQRRRKEQ
jgi:hypothetical protein